MNGYFRRHRIPLQEINPDFSDKSLKGPIIRGEVVEAILKLKVGKAEAGDNFAMEHIKVFFVFTLRDVKLSQPSFDQWNLN